MLFVLNFMPILLLYLIGKWKTYNMIMVKNLIMALCANFMPLMVLLFIFLVLKMRKLRENFRINDILGTLVSHAWIPFSFWSHDLRMVTYLLNVLPSKSRNFNTRTQLLHNKIPSLCFQVSLLSSYSFEVTNWCSLIIATLIHFPLFLLSSGGMSFLKVSFCWRI